MHRHSSAQVHRSWVERLWLKPDLQRGAKRAPPAVIALIQVRCWMANVRSRGTLLQRYCPIEPVRLVRLWPAIMFGLGARYARQLQAFPEPEWGRLPECSKQVRCLMVGFVSL